MEGTTNNKITEEDSNDLKLSSKDPLANLIAEKKDPPTNKDSKTHEINDFCDICVCKACLEYRELTFNLLTDCLKTRKIWKISVVKIRRFYRPILEKFGSEHVLKYYDSLTNNEKYNWFSSGGATNNTKLIHMELIHDLKLTDNVSFVLLNALLTVDDPHQLFELLAYQVEAFTRAYAEAIGEKCRKRSKADELILYILNGYDELNKIAQIMTSYLFTFESSHLEQFSLTWALLSKKLYQRWVHSCFMSLIPELMSKLKAEVCYERYSEVIKKYISYDDDITSINKEWRNVWVALNKYYSSKVEQERRRRIKTMNDIFMAIKRGSKNIVCVEPFVNVCEWETHPNRQLVWDNVALYIKKRWIPIDESRITLKIISHLCKKCNSSLGFHEDNCECVTCSIAGGPSMSLFKVSNDIQKQGYCLKCILLEKVGKDGSAYISKVLDSKHSTLEQRKPILHTIQSSVTIEGNQTSITMTATSTTTNANEPLSRSLSPSLSVTSSLSSSVTSSSSSLENYLPIDSPGQKPFSRVFKTKTEKNETYHLSWAVFKHLSGRLPYRYKEIDEKYFCSNCCRTCCLLAKKIINNEIAPEYSQYLIKHFRPVSLTHNEVGEMLPNAIMYYNKVNIINLTFESPCNDIIVKTFWTFLISAYASYLVNAKEYDFSSKLQLENFKLINDDIELELKFSEKLNRLTKFEDIIDKMKSIRQSETRYNVQGLLQNDNKPTAVSIGTTKSKVTSAGVVNEVKKEEKSKPNTKPKQSLIKSLNDHLAAESKSSKSCKEKNIAKGRHHTLQCCSDHLEELEGCKENHFSKMCFHEKECNHTRVNETRDRLRKKLSQKVNEMKNAKKTASVKNETIPGLKATTSTPAIKNEKNINNKNKVLTKTQTEIEKCNEQLNTIKGNNEKDKNEKTSNANSINKATTEAELSNESTNAAKHNAESNENHEIHNDGNKNLDEWIKDTLDYIEGGKESKKTNDKKLAKRIKQRQKKEETKRIEELQDLRSQFHDIYSKELIAKIELKNEKSSKKKNKKLITDLEANIKKLGRAKCKIEMSILELMSTVKTFNSNFKFSYLPTKEQQQEMLALAFPEENKQEKVDDHGIIDLRNIKVKDLDLNKKTMYTTQENDLSDNDKGKRIVTNQEKVENHGIIDMRHVKVKDLDLNKKAIGVTQAKDPSSENDKGKRIVTIRRVNLPDLSEPQVTVTAKGDSPDKDKLLYTFINGQIVPATSNNLDNPTIQNVENNKTFHCTKNKDQIAQEISSNKNLKKSNDVQQGIPKTKTQLKKERKKAKQLLHQEQSNLQNVDCDENKLLLVSLNASQDPQLPQAFKDKSNRKNSEENEKRSVDKNVPAENSNNIQNSKALTKKDKKAATNVKEISIMNKITNSNNNNNVNSHGISPTQSKTTNTNSKNNKNLKQQNQNNKIISNNRKNSEGGLSGQDPKKIIKASKVVDNGQFDNNQFKMLHLDELMYSGDNSVKQKINSNKIENIKKDKPQTCTTNAVDIKKKSSNDKFIQNQKENFNNNNNKKKTSKINIDLNSSNYGNYNQNKNNQKNNLLSNVKINKQTVNIVATNKTETKVLGCDTINQNRNKNSSNKTTSVNNNSIKNSENISQYLTQSMQKLQLNSEISITPKDSCTHQSQNLINHSNVSIMDQLNRGVQVEDLTLPPGITLTKVDPSRAEAIRAKTESIGKLCQPMQPQQNHIITPSILSASPMMSHYGKYAGEQGGVIMVDAMNKSNTSIICEKDEDVKKSKRSKRKNKKKKSIESTNSNESQQRKPKEKSSLQNGVEPKMVTLRNPIFHTAANSVFPMQNKMPIPQIPADQPAAIIKNDNGMFTIRNPILQQAYNMNMSGLSSNFCQYNPGFYSSGSDNYSCATNTGASSNINGYSYFSESMKQNGGSYNDYSNQQQSHHGLNDASSLSKGKCISAIGSEIKNAQQKKMNNQWQQQMINQQQHNNSSSLGYIGGQINHQCGSSATLQNNYQKSSYYPGYDIFSKRNETSSSGNLFNDSTHNCGDESPPPSISNYNHRYLEGFVTDNENNKYDDMSFLRGLMPGQSLNSEVTIHNINESKFNRNSISPITHRVEITPISRPSSRPNNNGNFNPPGDVSLGRQELMDNGYGDNLFISNQRPNLNDNSSRADNDNTYHPFNYGLSSTTPSTSSTMSSSSLTNLNVNEVAATLTTMSNNVNFNNKVNGNATPSLSTAAITTSTTTLSAQNSTRSSPYSNDQMENFVHSMNSLKISLENNENVNMTNGNRWW